MIFMQIHGSRVATSITQQFERQAKLLGSQLLGRFPQAEIFRRGFSLVKKDAARKMPRANKKRSSENMCVSKGRGNKHPIG